MKILRSKSKPIDPYELIDKYNKDTITYKEHLRLDSWVGASDSNMKLFEKLTEGKDVDLEEGIEKPKSFRIVAKLIASYVKKKLSSREREELDLWLGANDKHQKLFKEIIDKNRIKKALKIFMS